LNTTNPIFIEGLKTTGFEICDQLEWKLPDHIIVPIGSGKHLYAIDRFIKEICELGLINKEDSENSSGRYSKSKKPMLHGVTVAGSVLASKSHHDRGYEKREKLLVVHQMK
jgi:threonine synthase